MSSYSRKGRGDQNTPMATGPTRPASMHEQLIGNAAVQEQMTQRGADQREHRGLLGALGGGLGHGQPGKHDDAKKDPKAATVTGARYGGTFEGDRWNRRGGGGDAGLGKLGGGPGRNFAGNGKGKASEGDDEGPAPTAYPTTSTPDKGSDGPKASQGDEAGTAKGVVSGKTMGPSRPTSTVSTPREDGTGGAQHGPTPLDRGRGPGHAVNLPSWMAGGPGQGRGGTGQGAGGASDQDHRSIDRRAGGATDAEHKEQGSPVISLEQAMKANQWTDPQRGR